MSLRGAAPVLEFGKEEGIVVFRSFHTTLAIITTYAARGLRICLCPGLHPQCDRDCRNFVKSMRTSCERLVACILAMTLAR